jgi:hypothetical protein
LVEKMTSSSKGIAKLLPVCSSLYALGLLATVLGTIGVWFPHPNQGFEMGILWLSLGATLTLAGLGIIVLLMRP